MNENSQETVQSLQDKLDYEQSVKEIMNRIHAAKDVNEILIGLKNDILSLFDAERMTIYAIDRKNQEIYSKFMVVDETKEIRVPINDKSISGYVANHKQSLNIVDVYDKNMLRNINMDLSFDNTWDEKTGFKSKQALCVPIVYDNKWLMGIIQLLNKKSGDNFNEYDEKNVEEIAKTIGIAFYNQHLLSIKSPSKFDYLLTEQIVNKEEVDAATEEALQKGKDVEATLLESFRVSKKELGVSLSLFYKCPFKEFDGKTKIPKELLKGLSIPYLEQSVWLPLSSSEDSIEILIDDPYDIMRVDEIQDLFKNKSLTFSVGLRNDIKEIIKFTQGGDSYQGPKESIDDVLRDDKENIGTEDIGVDDVGGSEVSEDDSAIVKLANHIIVDAYNMGASDIHLEPYGAKMEVVVRYRVDGSCIEYEKLPASYRKGLVSRFKVMSRLDIAEKRKPQDGKIKFRLGSGEEIELRVATLPTCNNNEDVVMRILAASKPIPMDKLGMSERNLKQAKIIMEKPYGIALCVGPTGSGKTTTLHSFLGFINRPDRKIWTAEDPVEITQYGLRQVQVQSKIGFTFAAAMRAFLRADPDVIMVGEMRDEETAHIGIEASLTGHLVLSTLHTNSAAETVIRLLDMGLDPFNFADALLGILAQRLVKRLCKCKERYHPSQDEFDNMVEIYGREEFEHFGMVYDNNFSLFRPKGCDTCKGSGYKGRAGIHELLVGTDMTKNLIQSKAKVSEILKAAKSEGMVTLVQDGIEKTLMGVTDLKQVKAVAIK